MEEALRAALKAVAALTALVGPRIDWGARPAGAALPAVRLFEISGVPQMTLTAPSGWTRSRVQIEAWGRTYKAARDASDAIVAGLHGKRLQMSGVSLRTFVLSRRTDDDTDDVGVLYRNSLDVLVWHAAA